MNLLTFARYARCYSKSPSSRVELEQGLRPPHHARSRAESSWLAGRWRPAGGKDIGCELRSSPEGYDRPRAIWRYSILCRMSRLNEAGCRHWANAIGIDGEAMTDPERTAVVVPFRNESEGELPNRATRPKYAQADQGIQTEIETVRTVRQELHAWWFSPFSQRDVKR